ncbi:hypothetical protein EB796_008623 [Bugula neritina]|uniref:Uncharacterized protein n=1 Tax=Bugula neritina TaxID=10212 RepID=A0A7J7K337_BUGNE|nr:hypothetical protein EB796_008623 [Bugula neritina]
MNLTRISCCAGILSLILFASLASSAIIPNRDSEIFNSQATLNRETKPCQDICSQGEEVLRTCVQCLVENMKRSDYGSYENMWKQLTGKPSRRKSPDRYIHFG